MRYITKLRSAYVYKKWVNPIRYYFKVTFTNSKKINKFLSQEKEITYDIETKTYKITNGSLSINNRHNLRKVIMKNLKDIAPESTIALTEIKLTYRQVGCQ